MAKCPYCNGNNGFSIEEITTQGLHGKKISLLCCNGCDAVIHVYEPAQPQYFYGKGFDEIIQLLKSVNEKLNKQ